MTTKLHILMILIIAFLGMGYRSLADYSDHRDQYSGNVKIENSVNARSNTGGNYSDGSGTISTGDAKSSAKVNTKVGGDSDTEIKIDASAEANGEKAEVQIQKEDSQEENIVVEESSGEGEEASVEIQIDNSTDNEDSGEDPTENPISSLIKNIFNFFKNIF